MWVNTVRVCGLAGQHTIPYLGMMLRWEGFQGKMGPTKTTKKIARIEGQSVEGSYDYQKNEVPRRVGEP